MFTTHHGPVQRVVVVTLLLYIMFNHNMDQNNVFYSRYTTVHHACSNTTRTCTTCCSRYTIIIHHVHNTTRTCTTCSCRYTIIHHVQTQHGPEQSVIVVTLTSCLNTTLTCTTCSSRSISRCRSSNETGASLGSNAFCKKIVNTINCITRTITDKNKPIRVINVPVLELSKASSGITAQVKVKL